MVTQTRSARSLLDPTDHIRWDDSSPLTMEIETRRGNFRTRHGRWQGGVADGVEVVEVESGTSRVWVLPSRGMSLWSLESDGIRFGWDSPVHGPVHPAHVPIFDPSGLGWLEGFDELLVRCGLESNGAPEFDEQGRVRYPLHGRVGNLPADSLAIEFDEAAGRLELIGEVLESRLFFKRLRLRTRLRFHADSPDIEVLDDVTNELSTPATMQLLYHINLGTPLLGAGSVVEAPVESLAPRDQHAASEIDRWELHEEPQSGYAERVYFATLHADDSDRTAALLKSADGKLGLGVRWSVAGLPRFVVWKNTAAQSDGYVTGLEPATNFPNTRSYEESQGRVVEIGGGETVSFRLSLHPLVGRDAVAAMSESIGKIADGRKPEVHKSPRPGWSPGA